MQESLIETPKRIPKFKNQKGVFWLDGVKINWELEDSYCDMYHFDFNSYCSENENLRHTEYKFEWKGSEGSGRVPNLLTETGYRSYFATNLECYDSIKEHLIDFIKHEMSHDKMGKPKKKIPEYKLEFEDTGYSPSQQFTLIQMKGGVK